MACAALAASAVVHRRARGEQARGDVQLSNPFELSSALKFGLFFTLVLLGAKAAASSLGARGIYAAALVAGLADVDAITLSIAGMARDGLPEEEAGMALVLTAVSNTAAKAALALATGGWRFGARVALAFSATVAIGLAVALAR